MIDLHSHTTASDGTFSPEELVGEAARAGVRVLAITDHDTFAGYDAARPYARSSGLSLIRGIELSTKFHGQSVHLLGYFPAHETSDDFRAWVLDMQASRRDRNVRLIARLQQLGVKITLEEVAAHGHGMTARPHFAQVLVAKGYASTYQQAFDEYLDASAKGYVDRREPTFAEGAERIRQGGGIASLAHPIRLKAGLAHALQEMCAAGLNAIEAYHSDHSEEHTRAFLDLAERHRLFVTGGSDFHGSAKPEIKLGRGRDGNLAIPPDLLNQLPRLLS